MEVKGFVDSGTFRRLLPNNYHSRMTRDITKVWCDSSFKRVCESQGYEIRDVQPANLYEHQQLFQKLERYAEGTDIRTTMADPCIAHGFNIAFALFAKEEMDSHLEVLDTRGILGALKVAKSAGAGYIGPKGMNIDRGLTRMEDVKARRKAPNPCLAYARTSTGNKTRLIWCYPLEMTMLEAQFARPLINLFLKRFSPMAFGKSKFMTACRINREVSIDGEPGTTYCLDYSRFDSTISADLIRMAFRILETWFTAEDRKLNGWDRVVDYFIRTPIVMPDGHLYTGKTKGVPSGSYFTQLIDSIVNVIVLFAVFRKLGLPVSRVMVLGDDSIFRSPEVPLEDLASAFKEYGIILNTEKTIVGRKHFLGAYWEKGYSDLPIEQIIQKGYCPERPRAHMYRNKSPKSKFQIARSIAFSLARQYASGYLLIDKHGCDPWLHDRESRENFDPEFLGGLDRARVEAQPEHLFKLSRTGVFVGLHI